MVLFRLLFVAYAEDKDLLPYRSNGAYREHALKTLARVYPGAEPHADPFHFIVWENCGYLVDDTRRAEVS